VRATFIQNASVEISTNPSYKDSSHLGRYKGQGRWFNLAVQQVIMASTFFARRKNTKRLGFDIRMLLSRSATFNLTFCQQKAVSNAGFSSVN
jgi:hypothetical protein